MNILVTAATGSTGRQVAKLLLEKGHKVSVLVHRLDKRSQALAALGAEVKVGDLLELEDLASALKGFEGAYFCYPIKAGLIQATSYFAQAARENGVKTIVNMSQISARREAKSHAAQDHWIAERVFDWSGINVTHVRPTFFAEWLLYNARAIGSGSMKSPLFPEAKHAPVAAEDQASVIAAILDSPEGHAGQAYALYGAKEYDQLEIAKIVGKVLCKEIKYEQVPAADWVRAARGGADLSEEDKVLVQHLNEVAIDHKNGVFVGTNDVIETIGKSKATDLAEFVLKHKEVFLGLPASAAV